MNSPLRFLAGALSLFLVAGCQREEPGQSAAPVPPAKRLPAASSREFEVRLTAALEIASLSSRDEALGKLAADAGAAGESAVTSRAIREIASPSARDRYAAAAALWLARAGKSDGALEVARLIASLGVRDETLKQIATGLQSPSSQPH